MLIEKSRFLSERPRKIEGRPPDYERDGFQGWIFEENEASLEQVVSVSPSAKEMAAGALLSQGASKYSSARFEVTVSCARSGQEVLRK